MAKLVLSLGLVILIFTLSAQARIINIPTDFPTIQAGIDSSANGDTVLVQPGSYHETLRLVQHKPVIASNFLMTGDTSFISTTVIDADSEDFAVEYVGESSNAIFEGFTVQNASTNGIRCWSNANLTIRHNKITGYYLGILCYGSNPIIVSNTICDNNSTGIYCYGSSPEIRENLISGNGYSGIICDNRSNPLIQDNLISNNNALEGGGINCFSRSAPIIRGNRILNNSGNGIFCNDSCNAQIHNNIISGNSAEDGGGIFLEHSAVLIDSNTISDNYAIWNGGGIYCDDIEGGIRWNNIMSNSSQVGGGGLFCLDSSPFVFGNVFAGNTDSTDGGGLYVVRSGPYLVNNVFYGNHAIGSGGAIFSRECGFLVINSIFWNDTAASHIEIAIFSGGIQINASDVMEGWDGYLNIDADPKFRQPSSGDFRLMSTDCGDLYDSPCIDAADDFDGLLSCDWGLGSVRGDMGAYGGSVEIVGIEDGPIVSKQFSLSQNYPNPFNASTTIQYDLVKDSPVNIGIYDILGQRVVTLVNQKQPAGHHQVIWNATDVSSGIYFYKLSAGDYSETKKMVLLK